MIHQYKLNGYNIVLDTFSGSVHCVDDVSYDIISLYDKNVEKEDIKKQILEKYPELTKEDVEEAVNLIKVATQQAATDPVTGVIDMDMLQTGITSSSRAKLSQLIDIIKTILRDYQENARKGVKFNSLGDEVKKRVNELGQQTFNYSDFDYRDALRKLEDENIVAILGSKNSPTIRLIARDF